MNETYKYNAEKRLTKELLVCLDEVKQEEPTQNDEKVLHPHHYDIIPGMETIDILGTVLNDNKDLTPFAAYCLGNVIKYVLRAGRKNGIEDYQKARVYIDWLIEELEGSQREFKRELGEWLTRRSNALYDKVKGDQND